jgi:muconolactone delta-isomerase
MKCLYTTQNKESYYALPQETRMQIMEQSLAFVDRYHREGKCRKIYWMPDMKGSVSIWKIESDAEAAQLMLEFPSLPYVDIEVTPILDWDAGLRALIQYRERVAAAPLPERMAAVPQPERVAV